MLNKGIMELKTPNSREPVTIAITRMGYDVVEVSVGIEAVDHAHAIQSDHIVLGLGHAENL